MRFEAGSVSGDLGHLLHKCLFRVCTPEVIASNVQDDQPMSRQALALGNPRQQRGSLDCYFCPKMMTWYRFALEDVPRSLETKTK